MRRDSRPSLNSVVMFLAVAVVAAPGVVAVCLFSEAAWGHHSVTANILLVAGGLVAVLVSLLALGMEAIYLTTSDGASNFRRGAHF